MKSIAFPDIFSPTSVKLFSDHEATVSNLKLILQTELKSLFADPGYGCGLKKFLFESNVPIIRDLIVNRIYDTIQLYIPQVVCERKDINLTHSKNNIYIELTATNLIDYTTNTYTIALMNFS